MVRLPRVGARLQNPTAAPAQIQGGSLPPRSSTGIRYHGEMAASRERLEQVLRERFGHPQFREGQLEGFRQQAAEMMRLTRELDTKTLRYDWFLSADGTECEVREGYVDAGAAVRVMHVAGTRIAVETVDESFLDDVRDT